VVNLDLHGSILKHLSDETSFSPSLLIKPKSDAATLETFVESGTWSCASGVLGGATVPIEGASSISHHSAKSFIARSNDIDENEISTEVQEEQSKMSLRQSMALINKDRTLLVVGMTAAFFAGACNPTISYAMICLVVVMYEMVGDILPQITMWSCIAAALIICLGAADLCHVYCFEVIAQHLATKFKLMMMRSLLRQEVAYFDQDTNNSAAVVARMNADAMYAKGKISDWMGVVAQVSGSMIAGYVYGFIYEWIIALILTAIAPLIFGSVWVCGQVVKKYIAHEQGVSVSADVIAAEAISNYKVVGAFGIQSALNAVYVGRLQASNELLGKAGFFKGTRQSVIVSLGKN